MEMPPPGSNLSQSLDSTLEIPRVFVFQNLCGPAPPEHTDAGARAFGAFRALEIANIWPSTQSHRPFVYLRSRPLAFHKVPWSIFKISRFSAYKNLANQSSEHSFFPYDSLSFFSPGLSSYSESDLSTEEPDSKWYLLLDGCSSPDAATIA